MPKIITVTFHCAHNYGAVLQAYALQKYIHDNYNLFETACLDYRPKYLESKLIVRTPKEGFFKSVAHNTITWKSRYLRKRAFDKFIRKRIITVKPSKELDSKDNIFIVGSDQVWNQDITNHQLDDVYFLKMIRNAKKASYAASIGNNSKEAHEQVANAIKYFDLVGVREEHSKTLLKQAGILHIQVNIDPVFLLDRQDYESISVKRLGYKYVLVYTLETNDIVEKKIEQFGKQYKTVSIGTFRNIYGTDVHFSSLSPEAYLGLIQGAEYVITNSFHATAFSIIFEKEFEYIPLKNGRGIRIENLLSLIHMNGYICDGSMDRRILLEPYINRSKEWIREIVEGFHSEKERHYDGAI